MSQNPKASIPRRAGFGTDAVHAGQVRADFPRGFFWGGIQLIEKEEEKLPPPPPREQQQEKQKEREQEQEQEQEQS